AGNPQRDIEAERDRVGVGKLDLVDVTARTQDAEVGDDAAARSDQGDGFLGREMTFLVKLLKNLQLVALAEQDVHRLLGQVAVPGAGIDDERIRGEGS